MSSTLASRSRGGEGVAFVDSAASGDLEHFEPTGDIEFTDYGRQIVIVRELPQSPKVVWDYIANAARIERWFGCCRTTSDQHQWELVSFDAESSYTAHVVEFEPHSYLHMRVNDGQGYDVHLRFFLTPDGDHATLLEFHHSVDGVEELVPRIAPKWELILDRLALALDGGDVNDVQLGNYFPCQAQHYTL